MNELNEEGLDHEDVYVMIKEAEVIAMTHAPVVYKIIKDYAIKEDLSLPMLADIAHSIFLNVLSGVELDDDKIDTLFERSKQNYYYIQSKRAERKET